MATLKYLPPEATGEFDTKGRFSPRTFFGIVGLHLAALAVVVYEIPRLPEIMSWKLAILTIASVALPILGVTVTFHRGETHGAFKWSKNPLGVTARFIGLLFGHLAFQKPLILWALWHRIHHWFVDKMGDPHTPLRYSRWSERHQELRPTLKGFGWSHAGSFWYDFFPPRKPQRNGTSNIDEELALGDDWDAIMKLRKHHWVADLEADPVLLGFQKAFPIIVVARFVLPGLIAASWGQGLDGFLIAGVLTVVVVWNITWCTNSVAHIWGDFLDDVKHFNITGFARNVWWFFALMFGENWHRRHHRAASCAAHGYKWYEIDITKYFIWMLEKSTAIYGVKWMRKEREKILAEEAKIRAGKQPAGV